MAECEKLKKCQFVNGQMATDVAAAELTKKTYCLGDNTKCARYQLVTTGVPVPVDLPPNNYERAQLLREHAGD